MLSNMGNWLYALRYLLSKVDGLRYGLPVTGIDVYKRQSRWLPAPTVGLSWIISNEDFMKNQSVIDFMKLRASFGIINTSGRG